MEKIFTLELDKEMQELEMHLNKAGAIFLRDKLTRLIENDSKCHYHFMTENFGGNELSSEKQNIDDNIGLINHLKIMYWK